MTRFVGAIGAALLFGALSAAPAPAQESDSYVLRPGAARFSAGLRYTSFDRLFAGAGSAGLGDALLAPLTSQTFSPLGALEGQLNAFLAAGGSALRATPANLTLGTPDLRVAQDARSFPFRVEVGVLRGLEVGVQIPLLRAETRLVRFGLGGGTVGLNPDAGANARALAGLDATFRALGAGPVLPTAGSALGAELQALVGARGGGPLRLPAGPLSDTTFPAFLAGQLGVAPLGSEITPFRLGDLELDATYRLLSTLGDHPFPADAARLHYRVALSGGVRIPTGIAEDTARVFPGLTESGLGGAHAAAVADLFMGRIWGTASVALQAYTGADVLRLVAPASTPFVGGPARTVRWTPGSEISVRASPRYRITEHLAAGAEYELMAVGRATFEGDGADVLARAGGIAQRVGVQLRYSTLASWLGGAALLPSEVIFGFDTTLSGPEGIPDATTVRVQGSLFRTLWGRR